LGFLALLACVPFWTVSANAQPPARGGAATGPGRGSAFGERPPADPAAVERGKGLFTTRCGFCHGPDARGGEDGPNLLRSELVLDDKNGESIGTVVKQGRPGTEMPAFDFTDAQISDIAAYIHSFHVGGRDTIRKAPPSIVVGDATAGAAYFQAKCAACHSATGDLNGIASRISDPKTLQQAWLMPGGRGGRGAAPPAELKPVTVTVTLNSGEKFEGRLKRIDDFTVSLIDHDGMLRTFPRDGDRPKVQVHDPLDAHRELLAGYTDKDIHDLTAYMVTLK
jgi:mono/diheme cytochrome c family protein